MELLKTLKLSQYQRNNRNNPALQRRIKLVVRISGQILLAQDPNYKSNPTVYALLQMIVVNCAKLK